MKRLSLVLIVRDAEAWLPRFLTRHRDLADELVAVDTGSVDSSVALLSAAGGRIVDHRWADDFAAARNVGLEAARYPWIMILDADELVGSPDFPRIRDLAEEPPERAYLQAVRNYCHGHDHLEWQPLRGDYAEMEEGMEGFFESRRVGLFPNDPQIRFKGRVHETILPSLDAAGVSLGPDEIPVHHFGYVASAEANAERRVRYRHLVGRKLEDDPEDAASLLEMGSIQLEDGQAAEAEAVLIRLVRGTPGLRPVVRAHVLLAGIHSARSEFPEARKLLEEAVRQDPRFLFGWVGLLRLLAATEAWGTLDGKLNEAKRFLGPDEPLVLREELRCRVKTGDLAGGLKAARRLSGICPGWAEIQALESNIARFLERQEPAG